MFHVTFNSSYLCLLECHSRLLNHITLQEAVCKFKTSMTGAQVASYDYVQSNNATAMQVALMEYGPLATALTVIESFFAYG